MPELSALIDHSLAQSLKFEVMGEDYEQEAAALSNFGPCLR